MLVLDNKFDVASKMILEASCRLWPLCSSFNIELDLSIPFCTAQHQMSVCIRIFFRQRYYFPSCNSLQTAAPYFHFSASNALVYRRSEQPYALRYEKKKFVMQLLDVSCAANLTRSFYRFESLSWSFRFRRRLVGCRFFIAAATVAVVVVFDVTGGNNDIVYRRQLDWQSPSPCDMLDLDNIFDIASQMMLITSFRL